MEKKVNDKFDECLNNIYGGYVKLKSKHGKANNYLGMTYDLCQKKK